MTRLRVRRTPATEDADPAGPARARAAPWSLATRLDAGSRLDLRSRIELAGYLQGTAGNAAMGRLLGLARTDQRKEPPRGVSEIGAASAEVNSAGVPPAGASGALGLTLTTYANQPPIFMIGKTEKTGAVWSTRPSAVQLPSLDHRVLYPAPGRHLLHDIGPSARKYLDVTSDWSARILEGEEEHVNDRELAWQTTWGSVAGAINEMANGKPVTGATGAEAEAAAWQKFLALLPAALRPKGDSPSGSAQLAKWGRESPEGVFTKLMGETDRARDLAQWHTPSTELTSKQGKTEIVELGVGSSRIGQVPSQRLIGEAWDRLAHG